MNDHKKEETMLPDWMCSGETYVPSKDKEAFLTKSTKSVYILFLLHVREIICLL